MISSLPRNTVVRCQLMNHDMDVGFAVIQTDEQGRWVAVSTPLVMQSVDPDGGEYIEPTAFTIPVARGLGSRTSPALQVLMDDLWKCGVRPTEGAGSAGHAAATAKHLAALEVELLAAHQRETAQLTVLLETARAALPPRPAEWKQRMGGSEP